MGCLITVLFLYIENFKHNITWPNIMPVLSCMIIALALPPEKLNRDSEGHALMVVIVKRFLAKFT